MVTTNRGATQFLTGVTEFDPGAALAPHFHNCQESVVILDGRAAFETANGKHRLRKNDVTLVPTGVVHRFRNLGRERLRILFIYGSINVTRTVITES